MTCQILLDSRFEITRRDCVEELLANGGDSLAYNRDYNLACDLTDNRAPVWTLLVHDMQWRTCLQVRCTCTWRCSIATLLLRKRSQR